MLEKRKASGAEREGEREEEGKKIEKDGGRERRRVEEREREENIFSNLIVCMNERKEWSLLRLN